MLISEEFGIQVLNLNGRLGILKSLWAEKGEHCTNPEQKSRNIVLTLDRTLGIVYWGAVLC